MVAHLAQGLSQHGLWQPVVMVYDQNNVEPIDHFFLKNNIAFYRLHKGRGFSFKLIFEIFQIIKKEKISVIHCHHLGSLIIAAVLKLFSFGSLRIVYTQHSFIHLNTFTRYRLFEKFFCYFADVITAVSEQVQKEFSSYGISQKKIHLILNGTKFADCALTTRLEINNLRVRILHTEGITDPRLPSIKTWILYLGRIHQGKGQDSALAVWNELTPERRVNTALILIGPVTDPMYFEHLKDLISTAKNNENIFVLQPTLHATEWMQASDLFMSSSASEGGPMAPLEALGSGIPCLLSDIEGHRIYRQWAQIYDLKNPREGAQLLDKKLSLIEAVENFTAFKQQHWQNAADLRARYSVSAMVTQYEKLYQP